MNRIVIKISNLDDFSKYCDMGFAKDATYDNVYKYKSEDERVVAQMIEKLRDIGVPFSTHRYGGADEWVEWLRDRGIVGGIFKRLRKLGVDWDDDAPFLIEEF